MCVGKALDLSHASHIEGFDAKFSGGDKHAGLAGAEVVIVTAGLPRKPGMSRDDLLAKNTEIIKTVAKAIKQNCQNPFIICVTNPLDAMVQLMKDVSGAPSHMVCGMAGSLDSGRFCYFLAERLGVSVKDVHSLVLGGHGDTMVPMVRHTSVAGIPLIELIKMGSIQKEEVDAIVKRTRGGGAEIVNLLKNGSAFYAPATSAIAMAESYLKDQKRVICCSAYLNGEYGVTGIFVGVPTVIGAGGIEKVLQLDLNEDERGMFNHSVEAVRDLIAAVPKSKL
eukprot:Selendium_serpulae@DN2255_c0_g1_i1.p1